jgi:electron transport complex protein RnfD
MHNQFEQNVIADGFSGATFLVNSFHEQPSSTVASFTAQNMGSFTIFNFQARILICISFILSGLFLAYMKIIDHKITLAFLLTAMAFATICYLVNPNKFLPPLYHLIFGATIFGAFFIITDPVTAVSKPKGAWLYGGLIGILFILIRNFGGYPDAMAFSVLLGNAFAPLISIMTRRRIFGYNSKPGDMNE